MLPLLRSAARGGVIDHLTPISRGGLSTVANMRVVCVVCNTSKKDRLLDEWSPPLLVGR